MDANVTNVNPKAIYQEIKMRVIYEPRGKAWEYAELACNLMNGCSHACKYCYAPAIRRQTLDKWCADPQPRKNILELLEKDARQLSGDPREVLFCFMSDPYQNEAAANLTRQALEIMAKHDCRATILTKGGTAAIHDFGLLAENNYKFGSSICFSNDFLRREWEPHAASILSRYQAIMEAKRQGIYTWVSVEPVIDPREALKVIEDLSDYVDLWKIGKLNHMPQVEKEIDWKKFLEDVIKLLKASGANYYIKKDLLAYDDGKK